MVMFPLAVCALIGLSFGVSTKMNFGNDEMSSVVTNTTKVEDEDVEVKHTIVVSTKLKNNRRGIHGYNDDRGTIIYNIGEKETIEKENSGEVPIIAGYKAIETTQIRTPDTRHKTANPITVESRNLRDEYDTYPNMATHPMQWKPSSFYNNINTWNQDFISQGPSNRPYYLSKQNRRIADGTVKEFYCRRCMELSNGVGFRDCDKRTFRTTTPKVKIDGKLVKLN